MKGIKYLISAFIFLTGGGDTGDDRQNPDKCRGSQEKAQRHSFGATNRRK